MAERNLHSDPLFLELTQDFRDYDGWLLDEALDIRTEVLERIDKARDIRNELDALQDECYHGSGLVTSIGWGRFQCMACGLVRHRTFGGIPWPEEEPEEPEETEEIQESEEEEEDEDEEDEEDSS